MLFAALVFSASLLAQRNSGESMADRQVERMKTALSLSDDQVARLKKANTDFREGHRAMVTDTTLTRGQLMARGKELMEGREKSVKQILTKEQYEKWMNAKPAATRRTWSEKRPDPRGGRGQHIERMKTTLGLSDDQVKGVESANAKMMEQFRGLRADTTLTREDRMKEHKRIAEERRASISKILTKEQYEKFAAFEKKPMRERQQRGPALKTR